MRSKTIIALLLLSCSALNAQEMDTELFFRIHTGIPYQDLNVRNEIIATGTDLCSIRYALLKPILDGFKDRFTVLDLGAAQGYFSFSIAHDYPKSSCIMIDANTDYYGNHGNILYDLCHLNNHLKNICYFNKKMTLSTLKTLEKEEHFDVVFAMLVVHLMGDSLSERIEIIETLLKLGTNLVLEVSNNVAPDLFDYVEFLSKKMDCKYLGEVTRHRIEFCPYHEETCPCTGKLYWFKKKNRKRYSSKNSQGIKEETFVKFNGVFPN